MDGETSIGSRAAIVDEFNTNERIDVFLLTTKVGGLGLNLIGADRVVLLDPDWVSLSLECLMVLGVREKHNF
jgi:DNA excision repair protein ERCC-6